jgi:poly(A) polymerase
MPPPDAHDPSPSAVSDTVDSAVARAFAVEIVRQLRDAGHQALWAGGCVRDQLRGVDPEDYDVATSATPDEVRALFGRRRTLAIGEQFGVVIVLGRVKNAAGATIKQQVEVATFRKDADYKDGRHPTSVEFSSPEEDAKRRDFTINGLFFDPIEGRVIDYVAGQRDLEQGILRAIGDPDQRFDEDKLRLLRAVRLASTLQLQIEPKTEMALAARATELSIVSEERIATELRKTLVNKNRACGAELLRRTGLLAVIFPETLSDTFQDQWQTTLGGLRAIGEPPFGACLAMLFRTVENDTSAAAEAVAKAARRQKFSSRETQLATWLVANEPTIQNADSAYWPTVQRLLMHADIEHLFQVVSAVHAAGSASDHGGVAFCRAKMALPESDWNPPALFDGHDLQKHGVPRGAIYRRILDAVRDAQLLGECDTREAALAMADRIVAGE